MRMITSDDHSVFVKIMAGHRSDIESWYHLKVQEICTASNRQTLERGYAKEEVKRLRNQLTDLRTRLADFEGRVSDRQFSIFVAIYCSHFSHFIATDISRFFVRAIKCFA